MKSKHTPTLPLPQGLFVRFGQPQAGAPDGIIPPWYREMMVDISTKYGKGARRDVVAALVDEAFGIAYRHARLTYPDIDPVPYCNKPSGLIQQAIDYAWTHGRIAGVAPWRDIEDEYHKRFPREGAAHYVPEDE